MTFYVEVSDVEAALAKAESLGGSRVMGPEQVTDEVEIGMFKSPPTQILGLAGRVGETQDLGVSSEQYKPMSRGGRHREAVPDRNRRTGLQLRSLDHSGGARKLRGEDSSQSPERLVRRESAVIALDAVVDLDEIDPADDWPRIGQAVDTRERGLLAVQPS